MPWRGSLRIGGCGRACALSAEVGSNTCTVFIENLNVISPVGGVGNLDVLDVNRTAVDRLEGRDHEVESRDRILGLIADDVRRLYRFGLKRHCRTLM